MRDPYTVLGVGKSAAEADIKKAFRKLAKAHHPDQNQNDPKAKERFAELNAAYEILGDKKKRGQFDRGEIDAEGKPRFQGFEGFSRGGPHPGAGAGGAGAHP
ncbi:MAG: DnaJ domain-containing protein, partial [Beijerinckiaceae bacterium]